MTTNPFAGRSILVADDDTNILDIVSGVLEISGYTVFRANDGIEARNILNNILPDLAVFDLNMPGYSGNELCQYIRSRPDGESVAVIILTARDGVQDKITSLEGGADEYITKPFNHNELLAQVRALLRIRLLNLTLHERNQELRAIQAQLVEKERALAVHQMAGAAAHNLGQPLSAIVLNMHLLQLVPPTDERYRKALSAVRQDVQRMVELLEQMKKADASETSQYYGKTAILELAGKPDTSKA